MTFEELSRLINEYFEHRKMRKPDIKDAALFLVSEVGEFADALMREENGWVRNNQKDYDIAVELADCLFMILVCAKELGMDPVTVLLQKMQKNMVTLMELSPIDCQILQVLAGHHRRGLAREDLMFHVAPRTGAELDAALRKLSESGRIYSYAPDKRSPKKLRFYKY